MLNIYKITETKCLAKNIRYFKLYNRIERYTVTVIQMRDSYPSVCSWHKVVSRSPAHYSSNCIFYAFKTLTTITMSPSVRTPNKRRLCSTAKLVQTPKWYPPRLTIYQINLRWCSRSTDNRKRKTQKTRKNESIVHAQSGEYYLVHFVWSPPKNWTPPLCHDVSAKRGREGEKEWNQRGRQGWMGIFVLFFQQSANNSRTFAERFPACPRGRPHLIRMNGLA